MNKVFIALLTGIAVGILIAPDKGVVTRKKLTDGFNDLADKLSGLAEKYMPDQMEAGSGEPVYPPKLSSQI